MGCETVSARRACEIVAELLHARLVTDSGMWIGRTCGRLGRVLAAGTMHVIKLLSLGIVGFEVLIRNWPCRRHSAVMPDLAEVLFPKSEQCRAVELGVAADAIVSV